MSVDPSPLIGPHLSPPLFIKRTSTYRREAEVQLSDLELHEHAGERLHSELESETQIEPEPPPSSVFMTVSSSYCFASLSDADVQLSVLELHEHAGERVHSELESETQIEPEPPPSSSLGTVSSSYCFASLSDADVQLSDLELHEQAGERLHSELESETQIEPEPPPSSVFMTVSSSYRAASAAPSGALCDAVSTSASAPNDVTASSSGVQRLRGAGAAPCAAPFCSGVPSSSSIREHESMMHSNCEGS